MKIRIKTAIGEIILCVGLLAAGTFLNVDSAQATNYYWDENGATAGFGTAGTVGTSWSSSTSLFSASNTGATAPSGTQATGTGDQATFGTDGTNPGLGGGTISVSGTVNVGTIRLGSGTGQGAISLSGGTINFAAAGTFTANSLVNSVSSAFTGAGTSLTFNSVGGVGWTVNHSGGYNGGGTLTFNNSGNLNLTAGTYAVASVAASASAAARALNLNGATLQSAGDIFSSSLLGSLSFNGGTLKSANAAGINVYDADNIIPITGSSSGNSFDSANGNITVNGSISYTVANSALTIASTGAGNGIVNVTGGLTTSGNSSSRNLNLNSGTLQSGADLFASGTAINIAFNGGTLKSGNAVGINVYDFDSIIPITGSGNSFDSANGNITVNGSISYTVANSALTIASTGAGNGIVNVTGGLTTSGNSSSRNLNLNGGALQSGADLFASGTAIEINFNGGTLKSGNASGINVYDQNSSVTVNAGGATLDTTIGNITSTALFSGSAAGAITVKGGNTFKPAGISNTGLLTIQDNSTVDINGVASSVAGMSGTTGTVNNSGAAQTLTLNVASGSQTFGGVISGAANIAVTKSGNGTQTLSGANTYTGNTVNASGTLLINGTLAAGSAVAVNGGTLGGSGTINGAVTVNAGGTLAPSGTFPATLTVNNTLGLSGTESFRINKSGVTYTSDKVAGVTTFTSGGTLNVALNGGSEALTGGENFTLVQAGGYGGTAPAAGTLPTLGSGLNWYLGNLPVNGSIIVNRAPVANAKAYSVAQGEAIVIPVASGAKSLATDADSDTLTVTSLGDTNAVDFGTANPTGGGASITYQNTSGSAGSVALFSYIVSDSKGGLATNSVSIQISPATGANLVSAAADGGNAYLTYAGIPGTNYALDHATSIVAPITWTQVQTKPAETNGFLRFTNNLSMYPTNDFYRTRYVP